MDLFGRKMAREGITTIGRVERVVVTEKTTGDDMAAMRGYAATMVYLWCRFTDQQGVVRTEEIHRQFLPENIPPPGAEIQLRYMPDDPAKFETSATGPVDPSVPRGWGAGIFEVEDLGGHHAMSMFAKGSLDRQRELFRTGQRAQAEVVNVTCLDPKATNAGLRHLKRSAHEYSLVLRAAGREIETRAWVPTRCLPQPGDLIQIAVSADGSDVALDTDERYDGPPAQALVFTTPAPSRGDVSAEGVASTGAMSATADDNPAVAQLSEWVADMKRSRPNLGRSYEKLATRYLDAQRTAGVIDDATHDRLLQEALSD